MCVQSAEIIKESTHFFLSRCASMLTRSLAWSMSIFLCVCVLVFLPMPKNTTLCMYILKWVYRWCRILSRDNIAVYEEPQFDRIDSVIMLIYSASEFWSAFGSDWLWSCFVTNMHRGRSESAEADTQPQEEHLHVAAGGRLPLLWAHGPQRREHYAELSGKQLQLNSHSKTRRQKAYRHFGDTVTI